jgi:hypothetical protein
MRLLRDEQSVKRREPFLFRTGIKSRNLMRTAPGSLLESILIPYQTIPWSLRGIMDAQGADFTLFYGFTAATVNSPAKVRVKVGTWLRAHGFPWRRLRFAVRFGRDSPASHLALQMIYFKLSHCLLHIYADSSTRRI